MGFPKCYMLQEQRVESVKKLKYFVGAFTSHSHKPSAKVFLFHCKLSAVFVIPILIVTSSNYWRWFLEVRLNNIPNLLQHLKQEYAADL